MQEIFRKLSVVMRNHEAPNPNRFFLASGAVVFPEGICPFCKEPMKSQQIWKIGNAALYGRWAIKNGTLEFEAPSENLHPHCSSAGNVCLGVGTSTENALFLGMNEIGAFGSWKRDFWIKNGWAAEVTERWQTFMSEVWNHTCPEFKEFCDSADQEEPDGEAEYCEYCQHGGRFCGEEHPTRDVSCDRERNHDGDHVSCEDGHETAEWEEPEEDEEPEACMFCEHGHNECGSIGPGVSVPVCNRPRGHGGYHTECLIDLHNHQEWLQDNAGMPF